MALPIEISCSDVKAMLDAGEPLLLIDCREPEEHALVHLPAAKLIPLAQIPGQIEQIAAALPAAVVIHCHHGMRSLQAASWLRNHGVANAQSMAGGIDDWSIEIDPSAPRY
ncbi:rhodanese-like domain-containing protein [Botrimarina hoheduenensis]|uniref:Putative adenylyltransferase/sulfurtransferase MoeZ n=1 Tax=Botrimarina hoheduenensis TaxID=2528000 RepID=A0A5C5WCA4_9BACT|nr:rhodanese-like domain-containing protein [Botrimarina hoheduenensis]TWT48548.1 putative adenylyltransferase/sulfurtransferase MoeZ [Botrimarina hoheduenensis]